MGIGWTGEERRGSRLGKGKTCWIDLGYEAVEELEREGLAMCERISERRFKAGEGSCQLVVSIIIRARRGGVLMCTAVLWLTGLTGQGDSNFFVQVPSLDYGDIFPVLYHSHKSHTLATAIPGK